MADFKLHIAEHFDAPVWRMEIDAVRDILFAEIRDVETREVSFAAIDLQTAETYFKNFKVDEQWLTGIESAYNGVLLIHYYEAGNTPAHRGLAAINGTTGQLLWNNYSYGFDHLNQSGPVFYDVRIQPRRYFIADINTGVRLKAFDASDDSSTENFIMVPGNVSTSALAADTELSIEPYGNIAQSLDFNSFRVVSLHTQWAGQLRQQLYLFDNGKLVFEDLLNADIQKMQPEAFVMYKHQLIYLKNKTELQVLNLQGDI